MNQKCDHCDYEWEARVEEPKSCPRCKKRFDYYTFDLSLNRD